MKPIRIIFTDCDGVLTDGGVYYGEAGVRVRKFNTMDGHATNIAKNLGIEIVIVTAQDEVSGESIARRANDLGLGVIFTRDKGKIVQQYLDMTDFEKCETAFIGNDITDLEAYPFVRLFIAPADAHPRVLKQADTITKARGGEGVLREVIDDICKYMPINPS
jgi:N-acylneuraminate cytidylyltransferase